MAAPDDPGSAMPRLQRIRTHDRSRSTLGSSTEWPSASRHDNRSESRSMTVPAHLPAVPRGTTDPMRRRARIAGVLYLITFVSIPSLVLYKPVKDHVGAFVLGAGSDSGVRWGALSEIIIGLAGI